MPADPPAIFTPPSSGSAPDAPGAVFVPPSGGSAPDAPGAVFVPAAAATPVAVVFADTENPDRDGTYVYLGLFETVIPVWARDDGTVAIVSNALDGGGLAFVQRDNGSGEFLWTLEECADFGSTSPSVLLNHLTATATRAEEPTPADAGEWYDTFAEATAESLTFTEIMVAAPGAIFTPPSSGSAPSAPGAIFTPPSSGSAPDAPGAIFTPPSSGSAPDAPGAIFTPPSSGSAPDAPGEIFSPPIDGGSPSAPPAIFDMPLHPLSNSNNVTLLNTDNEPLANTQP
jgi:hypothetical protein